MQTGRPKAELKLSAQEQAQLSRLQPAASRSLPHALVARAKLTGTVGGGGRQQQHHRPAAFVERGGFEPPVPFRI